MGGRASARCSAEQTEVARFWDFSRPPLPVLTTSSPTAKGAVRHYHRIGALVQEVGEAPPRVARDCAQTPA